MIINKVAVLGAGVVEYIIVC